MKDAIEKTIRVDASRDEVWAALIDSGEFGTWFRCRFDGPFVVGERLGAEITGYGMEGTPFWIVPVEIAPPERFAYDWPAGDGDNSGDAPTTRVTFTLTKADGGTLVTVRESGFAELPSEVAERKYPENTEGWAIQLENIKTHVEA